MGIIEYFRRKKQQQNTQAIVEEELPHIKIDQTKVEEILEEEIKDFFPDTGRWGSNCFGQPSEVRYSNLPCHLRDNAWMSKLLHRVLNDKATGA